MTPGTGFAFPVFVGNFQDSHCMNRFHGSGSLNAKLENGLQLPGQRLRTDFGSLKVFETLEAFRSFQWIQAARSLPTRAVRCDGCPNDEVLFEGLLRAQGCKYTAFRVTKRSSLQVHISYHQQQVFFLPLPTKILFGNVAPHCFAVYLCSFSPYMGQGALWKHMDPE